MHAQAMILLERLIDRKRGMTYDAARFVDHEEMPFMIMEYDLNRICCDRRFVTMNDVP